jgi:hypothetical protein
VHCVADLRRHPRPVLRPNRAVQGGRRVPLHELLVSRRLRGPRLLQRGDLPAAARAQGTLPLLRAHAPAVFLTLFLLRSLANRKTTKHRSATPTASP